MHQTSATDLADRAHDLLQQQIADWPMLRAGIDALKTIKTRTIDVGDFAMRVQFNPGRIISSSEKVDAKTIRERKGFLCPANLPPEQKGVPFRGGDYLVLCNPFPIFPEHFTIVHKAHRPQRIDDSFIALLDLAAAMGSRYTVFYNGPRCGASAPDHLHFQAGDRGFMTIESEYDRLKGKPVAASANVTAFANLSPRSFLAFESTHRDALADTFTTAYWAMSEIHPAPPGTDDEPMMNVLAWHDSATWKVIVFPRFKHRPSFYFAEGDEKILLSPASVDLGGVAIVPLDHDFQKLTRRHIEQMLAEVMLPPHLFDQLAQRVASKI
jgi:hypothetical protein